ncbi:aldo/keto reductase [Nakamurella sp. YIM 132087]|uniref:Aldo/keto reductase n=1 Tax=Nakamurella alba TaxID=2665158 RepID=A0A7K1FS61_9ACTN|nr:aldo/keto reductase [Nakamurella alba]MTD15664.1 aldo/keto reductase [Nakamurella alba]
MDHRTLRRLGSSGLAVSTAGLGCNNFGRANTVTADLAGTRAVVDAAIDAGINLFDVADIYGAEPGLSERLLGQALGKRRDEIVLATKFGMDMKGANGPDDLARGSRRYVRIAVEASLRRLGTDHIDLYQLHQPDPLTPIEETLAALDELVLAGKVCYIGHSNLSGWQLTEAHWVARTSGRTPFLSAQNEYSLLNRDLEREVLPAAAHVGIGILPFFPLANGLLTGKYTRHDAPDGSRLKVNKPQLLESAPWDVLEGLQAFADERGITMLDVAFGWLLARPGVSSVIAGATTPEQIRGNVAAATGWQPTAADLDEIDRIAPARR